MYTFNGKPFIHISDKEVVLSTTDGKATCFRALSEEDCTFIKKGLSEYMLLKRGNKDVKELNDRLKKQFNIKYDDIIAIGDNDADSEFCKKTIESHYYKFSQETAWKCFCIPTWKEARYGITHIDDRSSWNCMLLSIGNPDFGVVYTKTINIVQNEKTKAQTATV